MENKVTSYETSKRLHELGFDSESHCGWWDMEGDFSMSEDVPGWYPEPQIKAYDCHDLLMWLTENNPFAFELYIKDEIIGDYFLNVNLDANQTHEALAKAVIKILEERDE